MTMAGKRPSITVIIPCYNEEKNLPGAYACVKDALARTGVFKEHEIYVFNDFSTDRTGEVADALGRKDPCVKVVHNPKNMGFGYNYTEGVRRAGMDYVVMIPGDNEIPSEAIKKILAMAGKADIIIPYTANPWVRPMSRRIVSRIFVMLINALFGLNVCYYNGTCVIKAGLLKKVPMKTWGFAYMANILVRLLKSGASYSEVGVDIVLRSEGRSKAFRPKNVVSVVSAIAKLFWDVRFGHRGEYSLSPKKIDAHGRGKR